MSSGTGSDARLKVIKLDDEVFAGTLVDEFAIAATSALHVGVTAQNQVVAKPAAMVLRPTEARFAARVVAVAGVEGSEVETASIVAPAGAPGVQVAGGLLATAVGIETPSVNTDEVRTDSVVFETASTPAPALAANGEALTCSAPFSTPTLRTDTVEGSGGAEVAHQGVATFRGELRSIAGLVASGGARFGDGAVADLVMDAPVPSVRRPDGTLAVLAAEELRVGAGDLVIAPGVDVGSHAVARIVTASRDGASAPVDAVTRAHAHVLSPGVTALVGVASGGLAAVSVDNGAFDSLASVHASQISLAQSASAPSVVTLIPTPDALVSSVPVSVPSIVLRGSAAGTSSPLMASADATSVGSVVPWTAPSLRVGTVVLEPVDTGAALEVSADVRVPGARIASAPDRWFEVRADATTGAMRLECSRGAVERGSCYLLPVGDGDALELGAPAIRLKHAADGYTEVRGGADGVLAVSSAGISLGGGAITLGPDASETAAVLGGGMGGVLKLGDAVTLDARTVPGTLAVSSSTLALGPTSSHATVTAADGGACVELGPGPTSAVRAQTGLTLQAADNVSLRLRDDGGAWRGYAFAARSDGALLLNGHDLEAMPRDALAGALASGGTLGTDGWWDAPTGVRIRAYPVPDPARTAPPLLEDFEFSNGFAGAGALETADGFRGHTTDFALSQAAVLRRFEVPPSEVRRSDGRPTAWRVYGATSSGTWDELIRAGAQSSAICTTTNAYDVYRLVVAAISGGDHLDTSGAEIWTLAPAQQVPQQHSFTGKHLVVPWEGDRSTLEARFPRGTVVSVDPRARGMDSIAEGGFKARFGARAIGSDAALPCVRVADTPRDPAVFGVVAGITRNRWYAAAVDDRLAVNGLGEGAVLVCDAGGDIALGDLLCTSAEPGHAMCQGDDVVRSCTLGKATMACDFAPIQVPDLRAVPAPDGSVAWAETDTGTVPAYECAPLPSGRKGARIACVYMCS